MPLWQLLQLKIYFLLSSLIHRLLQFDIGKLLETSGDIIGRYESDEVKPFLDPVHIVGGAQLHGE